MKPESVMVVGGGVVGMCTALSLQERNVAVLVADPGELEAQASWGNVGRIAVEQSEPLASLATLRSLPRQLFTLGGPVALPLNSITSWFPFGLRFLAACSPQRFARGCTALGELLAHALPAWRRRLDSIGGAALLQETGHYSIWESARLCTRGRAQWARLSGAATTYELHDSELDRFRRLIHAPIAGTLGFHGTASITDLPDLHATLRTAFLENGGQLLMTPLRLEAAERSARAVVVAAGIGSASLLAEAGHAVPMIAERGYHIDQPAADWPLDMPPIYFEERSLVVTRFRRGLRASSFVEFSTKDAAPDARKWRRLRRHARELALPFNGRATEWMGSRPTLPDYLPAIGKSSHRPALYYAFGHQHLGLTLAAFTGELVAALVCGNPLATAIEPFSIDRFR